MTYVEWNPETMGPCPESDAAFYDDDDDAWFIAAVAAAKREPQQHSEPWRRRSGIPLRISKLTVSQGDYRVDIPLHDLSEQDPLDMSDIMDVDVPWAQEELLRFAEWFGYTIEPNPASSMGYRVISPSGKSLGGAIALQVIAAWQKNPTGVKGGDKKKGGGKGGGAAKTDPAAKKAEAEAKKAANAAEKLANSKEDAHFAIDGIDPQDMADRSKGRLNAKDLADMVAAGKAEVDRAKTPEEARDAVKKMKRSIDDYKRQMTKPPAPEIALNMSKGKLKQNLPDATALAGTSFDVYEIQSIIDRHIKFVDTADDEAGARAAIKDMRAEIAKYKVTAAKEKAAQQKAKADARAAQAAQIKANRAAAAEAKKQAAAQEKATRSGQGGQGASVPASLPKTATEWADYYAEAFVYADPEQFGGPGSGRYPKGSGKSPKVREGGGAPARDSYTEDTVHEFEAAHGIGKWNAGLTELENVAMSVYSGHQYKELNGDLRAGKRGRFAGTAEQLDSAIAKGGLQHDTVLYRGVEGAFADRLKPGAVFKDKAFVSTTIDKEVPHEVFGAEGVVMRIRAPKGANAAFLFAQPPKKSTYPDELEVLLPRGSKFKVISRSGNVVEAELVL